MSRTERAIFSAVLGLLWAWLVIQDVGLADRWGRHILALVVINLMSSVLAWYIILYTLEKVTNGHHLAGDKDPDHCRNR